MIPQKFFFTKGVGIAREQLSAYELALRDAGITQFNLVSVSSIFVLYKSYVDNYSIKEYIKCKNHQNDPSQLIWN